MGFEFPGELTAPLEAELDVPGEVDRDHRCV